MARQGERCRISFAVPRGKIKLAEVLKAMNTVCTQCGVAIPPSEQQRIDFEQMKCPKCGAEFVPKKR